MLSADRRRILLRRRLEHLGQFASGCEKPADDVHMKVGGNVLNALVERLVLHVVQLVCDGLRNEARHAEHDARLLDGIDDGVGGGGGLHHHRQREEEEEADVDGGDNEEAVEKSGRRAAAAGGDTEREHLFVRRDGVLNKVIYLYVPIFLRNGS